MLTTLFMALATMMVGQDEAKIGNYTGVDTVEIGHIFRMRCQYTGNPLRTEVLKIIDDRTAVIEVYVPIETTRSGYVYRSYSNLVLVDYDTSSLVTGRFMDVPALLKVVGRQQTSPGKYLYKVSPVKTKKESRENVNRFVGGIANVTLPSGQVLPNCQVSVADKGRLFIVSGIYRKWYMASKIPSIEQQGKIYRYDETEKAHVLKTKYYVEVPDEQ